MYFFYDDEDDRKREAEENARDIRRSQIRERFLDDLGFLRDSKCRDCAWMQEGVIDVYEDHTDDDLCMPEVAYSLAQRMCKVCKTTPKERREDALYDFFRKEDEADDSM